MLRLVCLVLALLGATARPATAQAPCNATTVSVSPAGPLTLCPGSSTTLTATASTAGFSAAGVGFNGVVNAVVQQPDGKLLVGGNFTSYNGATDAPNYVLRLLADGTLDPTFNYTPTSVTTGPNSQVWALALQADGKVLVGGDFLSYNGATDAPNYLLRLNADGSLDQTFNYTAGSTTTGANTSVRVLALQPDGKLLVGGQFTSYNVAIDAPNRLLRLHANGSLDQTFNYTAGSTTTGFTDGVFSLALQPDGKVLVGGDFTTYNEATDAPDNVLRLLPDGSLDQTFNYTAGSATTGANGTVWALALQPDGKVLVGGSFTSYNGLTGAPNNLLRLNASGSLDQTFNYTAGNISTGATLSSATNASVVYALALLPNGTVLAGGAFDTYNGNGAAPNSLLRLSATGSLDTSFNYTASNSTTGLGPVVSNTSGAAYALVLQPNGQVLVAGSFTSYNANAAAPDHLLRVNADGSLDTTPTTPTGATFSWLPGGQPGPTLAVTAPGRYRPVATLDGCASYGPEVVVSAPPLVQVRVSPAGPLQTCPGTPTTLTATAVQPGFNAAGTGFNGGVYAVVVQPDGKVLVGGGFTSYNGAADAPNYLLRLNADGSLDTSFNYTAGSTTTGADNAVWTLALQPDGKVLAGGFFTSYNGATDAPDRLLRLNADGSLDQTFNYTAGSTTPGYNNTVFALALQPDGRVLVGGQFTTYNGVADAPNYVLRLNANGSLDQTFNYTAGSLTTGPNNVVYALALQPDGRVLVGGSFATYNGVTGAPNNLLRLHANGSLDQTFNYIIGSTTTGLSGTVWALALQPDGQVLVGGSFTGYNAVTAAPNNVLRLSAAGVLDQTFNYTAGSTTTGVDMEVRALALQSDGQVLVGGFFGSYNGVAAAPDRVLRLTATGALDNSFNPLSGSPTSGPNDLVRALALQPDGRVLVGGDFTSYNADAAVPDRLLRLTPTGIPNHVDEALLVADGYDYTFSDGYTTLPGTTYLANAPGSYVASVSGGVVGSCSRVLAAPVVVSYFPSLTISGTSNVIAAGTYCELTLGGSSNATLAGPITVLGALTVARNGTLDLGSFAGPAISGPGSVEVQEGGNLRIRHPEGLAPQGTAAGAIQNTGPRSFGSTGYYYYEGTTPQVTGLGLPASVAGLVLDNPAGLALSQDQAVLGRLTLRQGTLSTGSFMATLGPVATLGETVSPVGRVLGTVQTTRDLSTAGTTETFGGLGLRLTPRSTGGASLPGLTLVRRTTGTSLTGAGSSQSIRRYFDIQPTTDTNLNVDFTFQYRDDELPGGFQESDLTLFKSVSGASGPWAPVRPGTLRDASANTVTVPAIRDFSLWTLGTEAIPLPVELLTFTATAEGRAARLRWRTASERNSATFEVQRSADGAAFAKIGKVAAQGTKADPTSYTFLDSTIPPTHQPTYYRLRQVDLDGTASYSPVRAVMLGGKSQPALYPSPARAGQLLTVTGLPAGTTVTVLDALGRQLLTAPVAADGTARFALPSGLAVGTYVLRSGAQVQRVLVE
ncbi:hypothetical protein Q5H93_13160 [Hymenobacter sp. ASUV-10]|uniref:T9SS type A sorting domain-containing protein n=1 Tax=Hymenobacter aranciens TaxID=3063996 RepID=A0ABT9BBX2_9BACT|nr:hypothetical protein [Hymenobacter sp. ASUV-10]MDO7875687.1 hypothetical protein [Hymenobacter sp. ASUV-10]